MTFVLSVQSSKPKFPNVSSTAPDFESRTCNRIVGLLFPLGLFVSANEFLNEIALMKEQAAFNE
jgi:hypothetical protein